MNLVDKVLVSAAGLSIYGIMMILFSGELSSENFKEPKHEFKAPSQEAQTPSTDVVVYDKEVDEIIQTYYRNIKENPDKLEEENRLIHESDGLLDQSAQNEDPEPDKKSESVGFINYKVKDGDSLWRISQKYNVPVYTIVSANPNKDKEIIRPGDELRIPSEKGFVYNVKKGDTLSEIAKKYGLKQDDIKKANELGNSGLNIGQKLFLPEAKPVEEFRYVIQNRFIWPLHGTITSGYGMRKHPLYNTRQLHTGIDIAAIIGTPIHCAADGVVLFAGDGGSYGNMAIVRHKDGYISVYAHASALLVKNGQFVKQGQVIAKVGVTGMTTGPHLHFEVKKNSHTINPIPALAEKIKYKVRING